MRNYSKHSWQFAAAAALTMTVLMGMPSASFAQQRDHEGWADMDAIVATLPVTVGWYDGAPAFYISTDASDAGVAAHFNANYSPTLGNAANTAAVDDIYAITNFSQGNIVPSAPVPSGLGNTNKSYSPYWQISQVTWNAGFTPHLLRSEAEVLAMQASGAVSIVKTNIVVNCPISYTPQGDELAGSRIVIDRSSTGSTTVKATLPVTKGWFNGQPILYLSTDVSDVAAGGPTTNLSYAMASDANSTAVDDIYAVTNFTQNNVAASAPSPVGPNSADMQYTPAWQVSMVTWKAGAAKHTLRSEAEIMAAKAAGLVTVSKSNIIVNCPIIFTTSGGTLPGIRIASVE